VKISSKTSRVSGLLFVTFTTFAIRLRSQRPLHVQGDAGHPG
jgi:hypothetical protein